MYWYSIYGTGATVHGIKRTPDGRVQFTVWLSVLWVPIVPISSWTGEYVGERPGDPVQDEAPCFTDLVRRPHEPLRLAKTLP